MSSTANALMLQPWFTATAFQNTMSSNHSYQALDHHRHQHHYVNI